MSVIIIAFIAAFALFVLANWSCQHEADKLDCAIDDLNERLEDIFYNPVNGLAKGI